MANTLYSFDGGNPANQNQTIAPGIAPAGVTPPTAEADTVIITSTGGNGTIQGFIVDSAAGNDTVTLNGSPNLTNLTTGSGNDVLNIATSILGGSITSSFFSGASGNDTFNILANGVGAAATSFGGGEGADLFSLQGNFSDVTVAGGGDRDRVQFTSAGTSVTGSLFVMGSGNDTLQDQLFGVNVAGTTVEGGGGGDDIGFIASEAGTGAQGLSIGGGFGADEIFGTAIGENTVLAGGDNDYVVTFADDDSIGGGAGVDTIFVGKGSDFAFGGGGSDMIFGQSGQNTLMGGNGADIVVGGIDDDLIFGNSATANDEGADTLIGGSGDDTAIAGSGDTWIFGDGVDALTQLFQSYTQAEEERIIGIPVTWEVQAGEPAFIDPLSPIPALTGTAAFTVGSGGETRAQFLAGLRNAINVVDPTLGSGVPGSVAFWIAANPEIAEELGDLSIDSLTSVTADQFSDLIAIDGTLVANTPGLVNETEVIPGNPAGDPPIPPIILAAGGFDPIEWGNDVLIGNSGNDVIFGGGMAFVERPIFNQDTLDYSSVSAIWDDDQDTIEGNGGDDVIMGNYGADSMSGGIGSDLFLQELGASNTVEEVQVGDNLTITFTGFGPNRVDVITDFKAADSKGSPVDQLSFEGWNGVFTNNLGSATGGYSDGDVVLYSGNYDRVNGTFETTNNGTGPDVLAFVSTYTLLEGEVQEAEDFGTQAVVLLGASGESFSIANFL